MIDAKQIPDEVVEAFLREWLAVNDERAIIKLTPNCRAALAAALSEWPMAQESGITMGKYKSHVYILPLPKEPRT